MNVSESSTLNPDGESTLIGSATFGEVVGSPLHGGPGCQHGFSSMIGGSIGQDVDVGVATFGSENISTLFCEDVASDKDADLTLTDLNSFCQDGVSPLIVTPTNDKRVDLVLPTRPAFLDEDGDGDSTLTGGTAVVQDGCSPLTGGLVDQGGDAPLINQLFDKEGDSALPGRPATLNQSGDSSPFTPTTSTAFVHNRAPDSTDFGQNGWIEEAPYAAVVAGNEMSRVCSWCFKVNGLVLKRFAQEGAMASIKLSRCSRCRILFYCSLRCQKRDWNGAHRYECSCYSTCGDAGRCSVQHHMMARIAGRIWILQRLILPTKTIFYGRAGISLMELGSRKVQKMLPQSLYKKEYKNFLAAFSAIFGGNCGKLNHKVPFTSTSLDGSGGLERSEHLLSVELIYDIVRQLTFPIISFDPSYIGIRKLGLGLYLNFTRFSHSCIPSLLPIFEPSQEGPKLKAQHLLSIGNHSLTLQFDQNTLSRFEFANMIEEFGTLFPFQEDMDAYLRDEWLIKNCDCDAHTSANSRKQMLISKFAIDIPCPECGRDGDVIAGVCDCAFGEYCVDVEQLADKRVRKNRLLSLERVRRECEERRLDCELCADSKILPSEKALCLSCDKVFRHKPKFAYDVCGPPALVQLMRRCELFDRFSDLKNMMNNIDQNKNVNGIRRLEFLAIRCIFLYTSILNNSNSPTSRDENEKILGVANCVFKCKPLSIPMRLITFNFFGLLINFLQREPRQRHNFAYLTLMLMLEKYLIHIHNKFPRKVQQLYPVLTSFEKSLELSKWQLYFSDSLFNRYHSKDIPHGLVMALTNRDLDDSD